MSELEYLCVGELLRAYDSGETRPSEVMRAVARRMEEARALNAFVSTNLDEASSAAHGADRAWADGLARPLEGVPIAVKDAIDVSGFVTTNGSAVGAKRSAESDAWVVGRLRGAGAIVVGKTSLHEFGWGITSANGAFGDCRNPWCTDRSPGGSSGGSAVAVAAGVVPVALGSDTGGSVRIPSNYCGVVGLKPSFGRISRAGIFPLAPSLDHPGILCRHPGDVARILEVVAGHDINDPATNDCPTGWPAFPETLRDVRIGVTDHDSAVPLSKAVVGVVAAARTTLCGLGATLVPITLPDPRDTYAVFQTVQAAEALFTHRDAGYYPAYREAYGADVRGRLESAQKLDIASYLAAAAKREQLRVSFARLFEEVDVLVTPVASAGPPRIGEDVITIGAEVHPFRDAVMEHTVVQNLLGLPACVVRAGFDESGIPVAIQLTAAPWHEAIILNCANAFVAVTSAVQQLWPSIGQGMA